MHVHPNCFLHVCPSAEFVKQLSHYGMKGRFGMVFILEGQNWQMPRGKGGSPIGMGVKPGEQGILRERQDCGNRIRNAGDWFPDGVPESSRLPVIRYDCFPNKRPCNLREVRKEQR